MSQKTRVYKPLDHLQNAWRQKTPMARLDEIRRKAPLLRTQILEEGSVLGVSTFDLITLPYPSSFGFSGVALSPAPYLMFTNRTNLVQFVDHEGKNRLLLFNPSDYESGRKTPFFARLAKRYGEFLSNRVMLKTHGTVLGHLQSANISPESIDYIAFDHLHTQDLRQVLGTKEQAGWFPNAKLLIQRAEWELSKNLHPLQRDWYIEGGTDGLEEERVLLLDGDVSLGKGIALIATPGHTYGNHSLTVCGGGDLLYVISENGVAADSYAPLRSKIPGLLSHARATGQEVILNGNTREGSLDQYTSMVLEKLLSGPNPLDPDFCNHIPSSELTASTLAPFLSPTLFHGPLRFGTVSPVSANAAVA